MAISYIIENRVVYNPVTHSLCSLESDGYITLAIPASLCFELLIKHQGKILTRAELLRGVWEERGMNVTANTLYQNISLLRKSLMRLQIDSLTIQTVSKRGFMIAEDVSIIKQDDETDLIEESGSEAPVSLAEEPQKDPHPLPLAAGEAQNHVKKFDTFGTWLLSKNRKLALWEYVVVAFSLLLLAVSWYSKRSDNVIPLVSYGAIKDITGCQVSRNNGLHLDSYYANFIQQRSIACLAGYSLYITNYYPSTRVSVISCRYPIAEKKRSYCTSTYFIQ